MTKEINLTQGQVALVDDEDHEWLNQWNWCASKREVKYKDVFVAMNSYRINGKVKTRYMHRLIINAKKGEIVDHINGNELDNQKRNLRIVSCRENCQNKHHPRTSKFPGVVYDHYKKNWKSGIKVNGKSIHLGIFDNEFEAKEAYNWACEKLKRGKNISPLLKKTSRYKGVHWNKETQKWRVTCKVNGKTKHVGLFLNEKEAHNAYLKAKELFQ